MPMDHYKMSMEAKPLRLLYSKYAPQALLDSGSIRPLGSLRRCGSLVHEEQTISLRQLESEISKAERVERYLAMSGGGQGFVDMYGSRRSLHSLAGSSDNSRVQGKGRSRSQDFENKYKIAVARSPQDQKAPNIYSKKVIHLPLLKINLETYVGDTEDSRALESTRKSLRHILDVNRKPKAPPLGISVSGVKQAQITQYHFKTPGDSQREVLGLSTNHQGPVFDKVHVGQISERKGDEEEPCLRLESVGDVHTPSNDSTRTLCDGDVIEERPEEEGEWEVEGVNEMFERDSDNASVMAQRLSSAATLGTSYRYLEFEPFAPEGNGAELPDHAMYSRQRTGMEGLEPKGDIPMWPSFDDMRNLRPEFGHACLAIRPRMHREIRFLERGSSVIMKQAPADSFVVKNGAIPKLKYTTHYHSNNNPKRKLEPIASAPHTERECPMCNLFKVKEPTPCPPNTPRHPGELLPEILTHMNTDSLRGDDIQEEAGENDVDETDKSDVEFRKRHRLINYDIKDVSKTHRRLGSIERDDVVGERTTYNKSGYVQPNTMR